MRTKRLSKLNVARSSTTTRSAVRGPGGRAVSCGSSAFAVPAPTTIASTRPRSSMHDGARRFARDPAAVAGRRRDLAVERHGPLGDDPRPAGSRATSRYGAFKLARGVFEQADFDVDARRAKFGGPAAGDFAETDRPSRRRRARTPAAITAFVQGGVLPRWQHGSSVT